MPDNNKTREEKLKLLGETIRKGVERAKPVRAKQIVKDSTKESQNLEEKPKQHIKKKRLGL